MAKVTSPLTCSGSIGHMVFSHRNGTQVAYLKGFQNRDKWRNNRKALLSHLNAQEFGGAAMYGSAIYKTLSLGKTRQLIRPYAHNHIAKCVRRSAPRIHGFIDHYHFQNTVHAIQNLDLSKKGAPSKHISFLPIGPNHCPTHVRVQGLREAAQAINPTGAKLLEFRVTRKNILFPEIRYHAQDWAWRSTHPHTSLLTDIHSTLWIPTEYIPKEGIRLPLSTTGLDTSPQHPEASFFMVEWREIRPHRKPKELKHMAIVRVGAIRAQAEHAQILTLQQHRPRPGKRYRKPSTNAQVTRFKHAHPILYLRLALGTG